MKNIVISGIVFGSVAFVSSLILQNRLVHSLNRTINIFRQYTCGSFRELYEDNAPKGGESDE